MLQITSSSVQAEGCNLCSLVLREAHGNLLGANGFVQVILEVSCGRLMLSMMGIALVLSGQGWMQSGLEAGNAHGVGSRR